MIINWLVDRGKRGAATPEMECLMRLWLGRRVEAFQSRLAALPQALLEKFIWPSFSLLSTSVSAFSSEAQLLFAENVRFQL